MILNELYFGRIVWNKVRMVKDPDTGRRLSRPNSRDQWQTIDVPQLRIVDEEIWRCAQNLKTDRSRLKSNMKRRPPHLLSGLLRCGCCGSGMSVHDRDKTGKTRIRCSTVRESGSCSNRRIVYLRNVENAVLDGMRDELKNPRLIEIYVRNYNQERQRLAAGATNARITLETKIARIEAERQRNIDLVVKGVIGDDDARERIADLKGRRIEAEAELANLEEAPSTLVVHPAAIERYVKTVDELASVLAHHAEANDDRAALVKSFRALVHSVTVHSKGARQGIEVEVKGKLAALIGGNTFPQARYAGERAVAEERHRQDPTITYDSGFRVVAGEGLEPPTPGL